MAWWPVEDAFVKSFALAAMVIVDPRWREMDEKSLLWWWEPAMARDGRGREKVHRCHAQVAGLLERDEKIKRENKNS
jgi:hypothetical protein